MVATALKTYSTAAVSKYRSHSQDVLAVYDPVFDQVFNLQFSDCRTTVTNLLQNTVIQSGFTSSNCSTTFGQRVQAEADTASGKLNEFSGDYGQVVLNVYRSYVGRNAMVESEFIEANINQTFASVSNSWANTKPSIDELRATLNQNINTLSGQLDQCFGVALNFASSMIDIIALQVSVCESWDANNRNTRGGRSVSNTFRDYTPEFNEVVANFQPYQW
jgi:hypothetical protein